MMIYAFFLAFFSSLTVLQMFLPGPFHWTTPVAALGILVVFAVSSFADRHHVLGTFAILLVLFGTLAAGGALSMAGRAQTEVYFWQWLVSAGTDLPESPAFYLQLELYISLIFGIAVYYFSVIRCRIFMLFLVWVMPYVLYAKAIQEPRMIWPVLSLGSLMLLLQKAAEKELIREEQEASVEEEPPLIRRDPRSLLFSGIFTFGAVLLLAAVVPKPDTAPVYSLFQRLFLNGDTSSAVPGDYSGLSDFSGNADFYREAGSRRLFSVMGSQMVYFKRQTFDRYDTQRNRWAPIPELQTVVDVSELLERNALTTSTNLKAVLRRMEELDPEGLKSRGLDRFAKGTPGLSPAKLSVTALNFAPAYYLSASHPLDLSVSGEDGFTATRADTFYVEGGQKEKNLSYTLSVEDREDVTELLASGICRTSYEAEAEAYRWMRDTLLGKGEGATPESHDAELLKVVEAFAENRELAAEYGQVSTRGEEISEQITGLAEELTAGLEDPLQKAATLQDYFGVEDFVYDLSYRAPDDSPEYLLFEGKTGTCSDFASAYVLLARSVGVIVRYTEGYVPDPSGYDSMYFISTDDSHAYAEVYLPYAGWTSIDPTSEVPTVRQDNWRSFLRSWRLNRSDVAMAIRVLVLLLLLRALWPGGVFLYRLAQAEIGGHKLRPAYRSGYYFRQLRSLAAEQGAGGAVGMTPGELGDFLAGFGCDIRDLTDAVAEQSYAEKESSLSASGQRKSFLKGFAFLLLRFKAADRKRRRAAERRSREYNNAGCKEPEAPEAPAPEDSGTADR